MLTMINSRKQSFNTPTEPTLMASSEDDIKKTLEESEHEEQLESVHESHQAERSRKKIILCPHKDKKHYAKGMCHNCYHRKGKTKKAFACGHPHKSHYSAGMCQNCYLAKYYLKRKQKSKSKQSEKSESEATHKDTMIASQSEEWSGSLKRAKYAE